MDCCLPSGGGCFKQQIDSSRILSVTGLLKSNGVILGEANPSMKWPGTQKGDERNEERKDRGVESKKAHHLTL